MKDQGGKKPEEIKKDGFVIDDEDEVIETAPKLGKEVGSKFGETYDGSSDEEEKKQQHPMLDLGPQKKSPALKKADRVEISMVERL